MKITFVSDIHGRFTQLEPILARHCPHNPVVQLGDLGIGFKRPNQPKSFPDNFYFIHGNHSNPDECASYPNFLGRYGYNKKLNIFFVSGAYSIDKHMRIPGVSWWPNEELSMEEMQKVVELYNKVKPRYMVTHDCPDAVSQIMMSKMWINGAESKHRTRTGLLFDQLFQNHKPEIWIYGHYHVNFDQVIMGTRFICQKELGEITLDLETR